MSRYPQITCRRQTQAATDRQTAAHHQHDKTPGSTRHYPLTGVRMGLQTLLETVPRMRPFPTTPKILALSDPQIAGSKLIRSLSAAAALIRVLVLIPGQILSVRK
jgi:hypothetical protein